MPSRTHPDAAAPPAATPETTTPPQPPTTATVPAAASSAVSDVPIEYKPGDEVATIITHKVTGVVAGKPAPPPGRPVMPPAVSRAPRSRITDLGDWLDFWRTYPAKEDYQDVSRFKMRVTRDADNLRPGETSPFSVSCTTPRPLGEWPFSTDLNQFIYDLQQLEKSGGNFRVILRDADGDTLLDWYEGNGEPNHVWSGQIPNPAPVKVAAKPDAQTEKKPLTLREQFKELQEEIALAREMGLVPKEKEDDGNDLLKQLSSGVIPTFVSQLIGITTTATKTALENATKPTTEPDRGFWGTVAHTFATSERLQTRVGDAVDGAFAVGGTIAESFLLNRFAKQKPADKSGAQQNPAAAPDGQEDLIDYIIRKCENREPVDFATDKFIQSANAGVRAILKGKLANPANTEETILEEFISLARKFGKGEKAEALRDAPQTVGFIRRLRKSVLPPQPEETNAGE